MGLYGSNRSIAQLVYMDTICELFATKVKEIRLRKLRFLPPVIIESIMNGEQDPDWNVKKLIGIANEYVK